MVSIYTQLLLRRFVGEKPEAQQYAGMVQEGVDRMEALIRDPLTFSSIVHTDKISVGTADLSSAFSEALSVLKNRIEESGAAITAQCLPKVCGDTPHMVQVFQNLLSNALKYPYGQNIRSACDCRTCDDGRFA